MEKLKIAPMERALPKWPQMLVRGEPMPVEQAKEIIRRTDTFFQGMGTGNDHKFAQRVARMLKYPLLPIGERPPNDDWAAHDRRVEDWQSKWGWFTGEYVHNTWIASSYIGGPYGWCNPSGEIKYDANVGKWPSSEAVMRDWSQIAATFPWVDATVVLMDREHCEEGIQPICGFRVSAGKVEVFDPLVEGPTYQPPKEDPELSGLESLFTMGLERERGIPWEWIAEWSRLAKELFK